MNHIADIIASKMNGLQYRNMRQPILAPIANDARRANCVIVFGMSDDLLEFSGAIEDEIGAYEGTKAYISKGAILEARSDECTDCPHYQREKKEAIEIIAEWDKYGFSWYVATPNPKHETAPFIIYDDEEPYCRGIVIDLGDEVER